MKGFLPVVLSVALFAFGLAGCMTAQQVRDQNIAAHQQFFNSLEKNEQAKIRNGQIDIGFTEEMVLLAWGEPDRELLRKNKKGRTTIWKYTREKIYPNARLMSVPVRYIDRDGHRRIEYESVWVNHETREEYTVARVKFKNKKVVSIEQLRD